MTKAGNSTSWKNKKWKVSSPPSFLPPRTFLLVSQAVCRFNLLFFPLSFLPLFLSQPFPYSAEATMTTSLSGESAQVCVQTRTGKVEAALRNNGSV